MKDLDETFIKIPAQHLFINTVYYGKISLSVCAVLSALFPGTSPIREKITGMIGHHPSWRACSLWKKQGAFK